MSEGTGDAVLAWTVLRHVRGYVDAWDLHATQEPQPGIEPGPFRIRVRSEADAAAAAFELLAWQDPHDAEGPASPFWRQDAMPEAFIDPDEPPLAEIVGEGGAVEGLRLLDGNLVLKVESGGAAVQLRIRDAAPFPKGAGIAVKHGFGLRIPHSMRRMQDFWNVAGHPVPRTARGRRGGTRGRSCW
ncbi:MAG: hypothetical protein OXI66_01930 [Boseongicola sp.]|nr:hypothetical protein [Boseongicola sp.]